jgi:hypothetical protein
MMIAREGHEGRQVHKCYGPRISLGYFSILLSFPFATTSSYETAAWDEKRREKARR